MYKRIGKNVTMTKEATSYLKSDSLKQTKFN